MSTLTTALSQVFWISLGAMAVGQLGSYLIKRRVR
jgi:hypothetical protein